MNLLFLTQSKTLEVFYDVMHAIGERTDLGKVGFYIADSAFYDSFKKQYPEISSGPFELLKEWEIIGKSRHVQPDVQKLRAYEKSLGDPVLWNALVADRRIYLGSRATLEQDYMSRFGHERMLAILQVGLEEMEAMFDRVQPDVVVGFICVTIGEYLAYLMAKVRNIAFVNLRPTRIRNYFYGGESVLEPSKKLEETFRQMLSGDIPEHIRGEVSSYVSEVRKTHAMYEGVLPPPGSSSDEVSVVVSPDRRGFAQRLGTLVKRYYDYTLGEFRNDNHQRGVFYPIWFERVKKPIRNRIANLFLGRHYVSSKGLDRLEYVFYPLHKEPEVTLLVYSRPYLNQIEVMRNFARSLPVGMKLVVKEHPGAVGYRPLSYYRKILSIPNVLLAPPQMTTRELVQNARLVAVIGGSVGLEAIIMKKPLVVLGRVPFSFFPKNMVRYAHNLDRLGNEIADLLENHEHDEAALVAYLAAVMKTSVPIDFYSRLLGRPGVLGAVDAGIDDAIRTEHLTRLADYILENYFSQKSGTVESIRGAMG